VRICGALAEINSETGRATAVKRVVLTQQAPIPAPTGR
jgi:hypothetical protein